ncbi:MAG: SDR family oxidoreductase [Chlamydiales bacterium]|nr:SDR family oxidoreductase [Chlamydiales bacterium]
MSNRTILGVKEAKEVGAPFSLSFNHKISITKDNGGLADALASKFQERGFLPQIVEEIPEASDVVIFLDALNAFPSWESACIVNQKAFIAAKAISTRFWHKGGLFVTIQDSGGKFSLDGISELQSITSGLTGLVKTAAQEWPKAFCKAIDIQRAHFKNEELAEKIINEILLSGPLTECGLTKDGKRWTTTNIAENAIEKKLSLKPHDVVIVSGGARGVTASSIIALAKKCPLRFLLLGRTPLSQEPEQFRHHTTEHALKSALIQDAKEKNKAILPKEVNTQAYQILAIREIQSTLDTLQSIQSEASYVSLDITQFEQVEKALNDIRKKWGKIDAIIHGAGVLADKLIAEKTIEQFEMVFTTKVKGLKNLLDATQKDSLSLIALFSSVAARFGNRGQCDYAMANEVLNKMAQYEKQKRPKCLVKSLNWGPWEGGMVTPELKALFAKKGIYTLSVDAGTHQFVQELSTDTGSHAEVVLGSALEKSETIFVSKEAYPFISSHIINEIAVVPAILVMEWFIGYAKRLCQNLHFHHCQNFQVIKGILLPNFGKTETPLKIVCSSHEVSQDSQILELQLKNSDDTLHYTAKLFMSSKLVSLPENTYKTHSLKNEWSLSIEESYKKGLFHGPDFQVIYSIDNICKEGGECHLKGLIDMSWKRKEFILDMAALDGCLQFLAIWSFHALSIFALPMQIEKFTLFQQGPITHKKYHCIVQSREKGKYKTSSNILLSDEKGNPYAEFLGVELIAYASDLQEK